MNNNNSDQVVKTILQTKIPTREQREENIRTKFLKFFKPREKESTYDDALSYIFGADDETALSADQIDDTLDEFCANMKIRSIEEYKSTAMTTSDLTSCDQKSEFTNPIKSGLTNVNIRYNQKEYI